RVSLVVGRHDIPRCVMRARCRETLLVRAHVLPPPISLFEIGCAEFPILVGVVEAIEEALSLLLFREMKIELDDTRTVPVQMLFELDDGPEASFPDAFVDQFRRHVLGLQDFGMYANDEDLLVVGTVEDPDSTPLWKGHRRPPEEVVLQLRRARMLEADDVYA